MKIGCSALNARSPLIVRPIYLFIALDDLITPDLFTVQYIGLCFHARMILRW